MPLSRQSGQLACPALSFERRKENFVRWEDTKKTERASHTSSPTKTAGYEGHNLDKFEFGVLAPKMNKRVLFTQSFPYRFHSPHWNAVPVSETLKPLQTSLLEKSDELFAGCKTPLYSVRKARLEKNEKKKNWTSFIQLAYKEVDMSIFGSLYGLKKGGWCGERGRGWGGSSLRLSQGGLLSVNLWTDAVLKHAESINIVYLFFSFYL